MLVSKYYYHETTKRIIALVGSIFSGIEIMKTPDNPKEASEKHIVPVMFGPSQKYFLKNEFSDKENYIRKFSLPRIVYQLDNISYEADKKSVAQQKFYNKNILNDDSTYSSQYMPSPYAMSFSVTIYSKYLNDIYQIVEQIIPYFNPTLFFNMTFIDEMDEARDVGITLNSINMETTYDDGFDNVTLHTSNLDFTVHSFYYCPVNHDKFIEKIRHNYQLKNSNDIERYIITIHDR